MPPILVLSMSKGKWRPAQLTAQVWPQLFQPIFLNEVLVKLPTDPSSDEPVFHISHIDRVYTLRTDNINERSVLPRGPPVYTLRSHPLPRAHLPCTQASPTP